tara:strand:- start:585 stop:1268 length:684 start_codon:yes stop_codon:yes gene_type:complete
MNWGRGKGVDYAFVISSGSYGDDGLDIGYGTAFENIDEVIKSLKTSFIEHISELIEYADIQNVIDNLTANGDIRRNKQEILNDFEAIINNFDAEIAEHQMGFLILDPNSDSLFGDSIAFMTEDQNENERNINLYNAIANYGGRNEVIEISFDSFVNIYMDYIEFKVLEKLRILYSDPKAINNVRRVLEDAIASGRRSGAKFVFRWGYYQEYHNYSWETTVALNFFNL